MKGASLTLMYFIFIVTWQLNILKIVPSYIPKLSTLEAVVTITEFGIVELFIIEVGNYLWF